MNLAKIRKLNPNFFKSTFINTNPKYNVRNQNGKTYLLESCDRELTTRTEKICIVWQVLGNEDFKMLEVFKGYSRKTKALEYVKTL